MFPFFLCGISKLKSISLNTEWPRWLIHGESFDQNPKRSFSNDQKCLTHFNRTTFDWRRSFALKSWIILFLIWRSFHQLIFVSFSHRPDRNCHFAIVCFENEVKTDLRCINSWWQSIKCDCITNYRTFFKAIHSQLRNASRLNMRHLITAWIFPIHFRQCSNFWQFAFSSLGQKSKEENENLQVLNDNLNCRVFVSLHRKKSIRLWSIR